MAAIPDAIGVVGGHPALASLAAFSLGRLNDSESDEIERHLAECSQCLARLNVETDGGDSLVTLVRACGAEEPQVAIVRRAGAPFELLEEVGRGGSAVVYRARQLSLNRVVAIKEIHSGADSSGSELLRFRREAEAVSQLAHPNILQVFDAGERDGRPFLAMEFVAGGTLATRLRAGLLHPTDAARLLLCLARAVEVAHSHGIIHRDLKPANVLFARPFDPNDLRPAAECAPKVADFGLARRLGDAAHTLPGTVAGTPSYMAPEQTLDVSAAVETADVYSLGAILYECLTGRPPFRAASLVETLDQVRNLEPTRVRRLQPRCPIDLETICLRCLEKSPGRRFDSAAALAGDLERFLEGKPIKARPLGLVERGWKWARRKPAVAGLLAVGVVAGVVALGAGWVVSEVMRRALADSTQSRTEAERSLQHARDTWNANLWSVGVGALADMPETAKVRRELLQLAIEQYQMLFQKDSQPGPETRLSYSLLLMSLAKVQTELGEAAQADQTHREALTRALELDRQHPGTPGVRVGIAEIRSELALRLIRQTAWADAEVQLRQAEELLEAVVAERAAGGRELSRIAETRELLAQCCGAQGRLDEARRQRELARESADEAQRLLPTDADVRRIVAAVYHNSGLNSADAATRIADLSRAADLYEDLVAGDSVRREDRVSLANSLLTLGHSNVAAQFEVGDQQIRRARLLFAELSAQFPGENRFLDGIARCDYMRAGVLQQKQRLPEAEALLLEALSTRERLTGRAPADRALQVSLAETLNHLGLIRASLGRFDEAETDYRRALDIQEPVLVGDPDSIELALSCAATCINLSQLLRVRGKLDEALECASRAVELSDRFRREFPNESRVIAQSLPAHGVRALALQALSRPGDSVADWDEVIELTPEPHRDLHRVSRAIALANAARHAQAAEEAKRLVENPDRTTDELYNLACVFSLCLRAAAHDASIDDLSRRAMERDCKRQAFEALGRLREAGYFARPETRLHAQSDPDLEPLHGEPEFTRLFENGDNVESP